MENRRVPEIELEGLKNSLKDYVDEECVDLIIYFFSHILLLMTAVIPDLVESKTLAPRTLQKQLKSKFDEALRSIDTPETIKEIGDCINKLIKSGWFEKEITNFTASVISENLKKLEKYDESKVLLEIFHKSCEKDLEKTVQVWRTCYPERLDEFIFRLFDAVRALMEISEKDDFESFAINILCSFQILSEAHYRKLTSFLLDCMDILEGKVKGRVRYIGESYTDFKNYEKSYLKAGVFFDEVIKAIRNSIAHADYEIDVENRKIIVKDKDRIFELTENEIEAKMEYLVRMVNIFLYFYFYATFYFAEKMNLWDLIQKEVS